MTAAAYEAQARLLVRILPAIGSEGCFALKGGTAINLFFQDMPRLSVDVDLVYLPTHDRATALEEISAALSRVGEQIGRQLRQAVVQPLFERNSTRVIKLIVRADGATVKVEPNLVIRGVVFPSGARVLVPAAEEFFGQSAEIEVVSVADLYGGKLCAALDRQHPRDLFDVMLLLEGEGLTPEIMDAFVVYLASHNRPMHELLSPNLKSIDQEFDREFAGMTTRPVTSGQLSNARAEMIHAIHRSLGDGHKRFLLSIKRGEPEWDAFGLAGLGRLPAIQWKLRNVMEMSADRRRDALRRLETALAEGPLTV